MAGNTTSPRIKRKLRSNYQSGGEGMKRSPILQQHVKEMRSNPTKAEQILWQALRNRNFHGFKFRRQQQLGFYIVDFVCFEAKLIIELDGIHHADPVNILEDEERTGELTKMGFQVLRFWNSDVEENWGVVLREIEKTLLPSIYS